MSAQEKITHHSIKNIEFITLQGTGVVQAGFPSPAADYIENDIDLAAHLVSKPLSTYLVRVVGNSMIDAHIPPDALLVVDKSLTPKNNQIIVACIDGEFTVKRFIKNSSGVRLMPANKAFPPIPITEFMDFKVWGTVTRIIIDANTI
jgi:DNA polymerase V